jgi:hypothetical protein
MTEILSPRKHETSGISDRKQVNLKNVTQIYIVSQRHTFYELWK